MNARTSLDLPEYYKPLQAGAGISMREIRSVVTKPENFYPVTGLDSMNDYMPDAAAIYYRVGDGLVFYVPRPGYCAELFTAITGDDLPANPIQALRVQWAQLKALDFARVYAFAQHQRSKIMCKAAGMNLFDRKTNLYERWL